MQKFVLRRLAETCIVLLGVTLVTFLMMHLAPGQPLQANPELRLDPTAVERWLQLRELDKPLAAQYLAWLSRVCTGNLGISLLHNRPVLDMIRERLPATLLLTGSSLMLGLGAALPLGVIAAAKEGKPADGIIDFISLCFISLPGFWLGMILIMVFSYQLKLLPAAGMVTPGESGMADLFKHMAMPVSVLAAGTFAYYVRYVRFAVLEILNQDFVRTAKAKGVPPALILCRHVLPNASIPLVTLVALSIPFLFTGASVTEYVFSWPGMGRWIITATLSRDYTVIMAVNLIIAVLVSLANLSADLLYLVFDPRVRLRE
ncbi:MAG: ABC transporter permease [Dethiobacter sp.]|nr:ABC transporter permease [Dethiobacter sp.]